MNCASQFGFVRATVVMLLLASEGVGQSPSLLRQLLEPPKEREALEQQWRNSQFVLLRANWVVPEESVGRILTMDRHALRRTPVYVRERKGDGYFCFNGDNAGIAQSLCLVHIEDTITAVGDGSRVLGQFPLEAWDVYWVASSSSMRPRLLKEVLDRVEIMDSFMREDLFDSAWQASSGHWALNQQGGGMPGGADVGKASVQRTVNPFTVRSSHSGILQFGAQRLAHAVAEARFYFGAPRTNRLTDWETLPSADMLLTFGQPACQLAFGWLADEASFALLRRVGDGAWRVLERLDTRPPLTNWVRVGLELRQGSRAIAYLDGEVVLDHQLEQFVCGPFSIISGGMIELDDVRLQTLPADFSRQPGSVFVRSRQFAGKKLLQERDPQAYENWTQGDHAFAQNETIDCLGEPLRQIHNRLPLFGDVTYEVLAHDPVAGPLAAGEYRIEFAPHQCTAPVLKPFRERLFLRYDGEHWFTQQDLSGWSRAERLPRLRFRRIRRGALEVQTAAGWRAFGRDLSGALSIRVSHRPSGGSSTYPEKAHHQIHSANLVTELFEQAPTEWNWLEGAFRMDSRWACQDQWNFLACGGTGLPALVSKQRYDRNQEHEHFVSVRPVMPWDAGDGGFAYDPEIDRTNKFRIFHRNHGWYNGRDLNFSFCTDGRSPLSGYSVIFGGEDNARSMLLRKGEVVAENRDFRPAQSRRHMEIHWRWWQFNVRMHDGMLDVQVNGRPLFAYVDREPLRGGHTMYWSVRNGFVLGRVASTAEEVHEQRHHLYLRSGQTAPSWRPLVPNAVRISAAVAPYEARITAEAGGGLLAVRHWPEIPVDLAQTPQLDLPLAIDPGLALSVHVQISGRPYVIRGTGPLAGMLAYLAPCDEDGEQFRRTPIPEDRVKAVLLGELAEGGIRLNLLEAARAAGCKEESPKVEALTIGNSSNSGYLQANQPAGAGFSVGTPRWGL